MKLRKDNKLYIEDGEPMMRSCWECNAAHTHLKKVNTLHWCFDCGRQWIFDRFLDNFKSIEDIKKWLIMKGLKKGQSTRTIDKGYRVVKIKLIPKKENR